MTGKDKTPPFYFLRRAGVVGCASGDAFAPFGLVRWRVARWERFVSWERGALWCAIASLDTLGGVWRKVGGLGRWGSQTLWRLASRAGPGGQRWDALIEASGVVVLLVPVTSFLSLAPDIVWRGAVDGLVARTGSRVEGRRSARKDVWR